MKKKTKNMLKTFQNFYDDFKTKKSRFYENKQIEKIIKTK